MCLLDLDYNLPVQVRDQALGIEDDVPQSEVGREYLLNQQQQEGQIESSYSTVKSNDTIQKLQRTVPYYKVFLFLAYGKDLVKETC